MNRPVVPVTLSFIAGIVIAEKAPGLLMAAAVFMVTAALLWFLMKKQSILPVIFCALGYFVFSLHMNRFPPNHIKNLDNLPGDVKRVTLLVSDMPEENEERIYFTGEVRALGYKTYEKIGLSGRVRVTIEKDFGFKPAYGDILEIRGKPVKPRPPGNPGEFDYPAFLRYQKVYYTLYARDTAVVKTGQGRVNPFFRLSYTLKQKLVEVIYSCLPREEAKVLEGLMLGNKRTISDEIYDEFKTTGTAHILAVSGMNVGLIALFVFLLLKIFGAPRKVCAAITMVLLLFFAIITGLDASIVRATIMSFVVLFGYLIERDSDVINSLAIAALFILLVNPADLFGAGFQLSFLATLGLVYFDGRAKEVFKKAPAQAVSLIAPTLTAQFFIVPVMANTFHQVSLISIIANLFVAPVSGAITILGFAMWVVGSVSVEAGRIFGAPIWVLIKAMIWTVDVLAKVPYAAISVRTIPVAPAVLYYMLFILLPHKDIMQSQILNHKSQNKKNTEETTDTYRAGYEPDRGIKLKTVLWCVLAVWFVFHLLWPGKPGVYVLAAGGINAAFIQDKDGKKTVMLGCDNGEEAAGTGSVVVPFLRYMGINSIDTLMTAEITGEANLEKIRRNIRVINETAGEETLRAGAGTTEVIMTAGPAMGATAMSGAIIIPCYYSAPLLAELGRGNMAVINSGNEKGFKKRTYKMEGVWDLREKGYFHAGL
ncbi:MAG: competence protein ComEC family protein [Spirochaetia bacterium]|nr:competence protein ComEC family protein [Spirochaetia bacterium]